MHIFRYIKNKLLRDSRKGKYYLSELELLSKINENISKTYFKQRADYFVEKTLSTRESGISQKMLCNKEVIVSLTSYGRRIQNVFLAIESIMQGTVKPNRIILWISESDVNNQLPLLLQNQIARGLEVRYCKDRKSYTKLIYALKEYPEACIVTIDDDVMYEADLVENLINSYLAHPDCVSACRIHRIKLTNGITDSYLKWDWCINDYEISRLNFLTGVGGVLYPPGCFDEEVINENVFMKICPTADDVWFNAMLIKKGTYVVKAFSRGSEFLSDIPYFMEEGLGNVNNNPVDCKNDVQIKNVFETYDLNKILVR